MMRSLLYWPFYPFLFCAYPIVYLAARNFRVIAPTDPLRPLLIALAVTGFLLLAFRQILRDWLRAGLLSAWMAGLFFAFGHAANALPGLPVSALGWIWLALLLVGSLLIMRIAPRARSAVQAPPGMLPLVLNLSSAALVSLALLTLAQTAAARRSAPDDSVLLARLRANAGDPPEAAAAAQTAGAIPQPAPDIYYIVLDSYERADALARYYHFDNTAFVEALASRGFTVAARSRSNYMTTAYALPAALHMVYLNDLPDDAFVRVTASLKDTAAVDFLRERGYRVVAFESGFGVADSLGDEADVWASYSGPRRAAPSAAISQYELLLLQTSLGRLLFQGGPGAEEDEVPREILAGAIERDFEARRARLEYAFGHLPDYAAAPGSHFVFAHVIAPHNPYLYSADGKAIPYNGNYFLLGDKSDPERNIRLFTDQLQYVNTRVLALVDRILAESDTPPVIILQADHGHDTFFEWDALTPEGVDLRSAILTAVYLPGADPGAVYPSISPVNTLRVVFNEIFGARFALLPDRTYSHPHPNTVPPNKKPLLTDMEPYLKRLK